MPLEVCMLPISIIISNSTCSNWIFTASLTGIPFSVTQSTKAEVRNILCLSLKSNQSSDLIILLPEYLSTISPHYLDYPCCNSGLLHFSTSWLQQPIKLLSLYPQINSSSPCLCGIFLSKNLTSSAPDQGNNPHF